MESNHYLGRSYVQVLLTLILIGGVAALAAYAHLTLKQAQGTYTGATTISVNGTGEAFAMPDIGQFSFSVRAEGATASEAQQKSAESINAIMTYLTEAGVEEKDIKTEYYNLNPKYRYEQAPCPFGGYCPPGEAIADGYEVSQTVSIKVRDLEKSGELISGVGERGATDMSGLNFTIDDESTLKAQAREAAIADAREKANDLAADLGMRIVRITSFYEQEGGYYPMYDRMGYGGDMAVAENAMMAPSIPTGENTITSNVTLSFELR